jgi:phenylpropionate dioxygenase-like ring-hydroxylating dioxygenase large terminal subunit
MAAFSESAALRNHWFAVALCDEVDPGPCERTLLGQRMVLWRDSTGAIVAAPDRCPHREAPLSAGTVTDGCLSCCYHGWSFGEGGVCVQIPSSDPSLPVPPAAHLKVIRTDERYGLVWVCLGEPAAPIAPMPWDDDSEFRRINNPVEPWATSATRMTDNFLDISHFPWVHAGTFGRAQDTLVPKIDLVDLDDDFYGYAYEVEVNNPDAATSTTGVTDDVVHRHMSSGFALPFTIRSTILYETGLEHIILLLSAPIDDENAYFTFVVWRNDDFAVPAEEVIAFDRAIGAEDKTMLEKLEGSLPLHRTGVVSVQADKASVEWRRRFADMLL